ncbi:MAG TPA: hypothetical protein VIL60_06070 [Rhodanobacter sp.]
MNMRKKVLVAALALGGVAFCGVSFAEEAPAAAPASQMNASAMNWFGGEAYNGAPALDVTAALVKAGGGASDFNFATALVSMLGQDTVNAEVAKLTKQYGEENVTNFINGMTFAVKDGLMRATEAGVTLPAAPADLHGVKLASTLVAAGTAADGAWWSGLLFDKALSHDLHVKVMQDIDAKFGHGADENTHKILNQAMFDVAQALKVKNVKLASLH